METAEGVVRQEIVGAPTRSRLTLASPDEKCGGRLLAHVSLGRPLKVLDLCSGLGSIPWLFTQMGVRTAVSEVELNAKARLVAQARAPGPRQLVPHDIWYWASLQGLTKIRKMGFDLVTGGFPCQQFSEANPTGSGLEGTESVFWAVLQIVRVVC